MKRMQASELVWAICGARHLVTDTFVQWPNGVQKFQIFRKLRFERFRTVWHFLGHFQGLE